MDIHKMTASIILRKPADQVSEGERRAAKFINYGVIYGGNVNDCIQAMQAKEERSYHSPSY